MEYGNLRLSCTRFGCGWVLTVFPSNLAANIPVVSLEESLTSIVMPQPRRVVQNFSVSMKSDHTMDGGEREKLAIKPTLEGSACIGLHCPALPCKDSKSHINVHGSGQVDTENVLTCRPLYSAQPA